jgi:hypothetical protein
MRTTTYSEGVQTSSSAYSLYIYAKRAAGSPATVRRTRRERAKRQRGQDDLH